MRNHSAGGHSRDSTWMRRSSRARGGGRIARVLALAALLLSGAAAVTGAAAQGAGVLPQPGSPLQVSGDCALTLSGTPYSRCECQMYVSALASRYDLSLLKVACSGRGGQASALSSLVGAPGQTIELQYDYAGGSGMWVTTNAAILDNVAAVDGWLYLTFSLNGPTRFENTQGKACVDGATGARC